MTVRRRRFVLGLIAAAMFWVIFAVPAVLWPLVGWWRGEAFYDRRPRSYWAADIQSLFAFPFTRTDNVPSVLWTRPASLIPEKLQLWLGMTPQYQPVPEANRLPPDPRAIPVLIELLAYSDNLQTRLYAVQTLGQIGPEARTALSAIRQTSLGVVLPGSLEEAIFAEAVGNIEGAREAGRAK
jgi:hypothetical protein